MNQIELEKALQHALLNEDSNSLYLLESKLVHRYGIETLPDSKQCLLQDLTNESILDKKKSEFDTEVNLIDSEKTESFVESLGLVDDQPIPIDEFNPTEKNIENIDLPPEEDNKLLKDDSIIKRHLKETFVSPPPSPTLKQFRRWLPNEEDSLNKAA